MTTRSIGRYTITAGKNGKTVLVEVRKRADVSTELKRKKSKSVRPVRRVRS